ncbi:AIM24 family protein [Kitasatospora sp. NBC_01266]|uniref:AIM24 family protein n=1 Tax=Kitasatospora sp. NBC_01266 TaxID=2903572 RepID=UPI002E3678D3|nr:AIM24 family protein [Kitasatospora sp. NBC_01266]
MQDVVKGSTMPVLEMQLGAGESIVSMHGELSWMSANVQMSQTTNSGGPGGGGLLNTLKRAVSGGGIFLTKYQAHGAPGLVAFASKVPGHIVPVDVMPGRSVLVHRHGWLCGTPGISPSIALQQSFRGGLWGGEGFVLQRLQGQGRAWIELSGELCQYTLAPGQTMLVHPGHVGMFDESVQFTITRVPGIANKIFGGDGYHLVALTGPGQIWLQSMPLSSLAHALQPYLAAEGAAAGAEGAGLGGIVGGMLRS